MCGRGFNMSASVKATEYKAQTPLKELRKKDNILSRHPYLTLALVCAVFGLTGCPLESAGVVYSLFVAVVLGVVFLLSAVYIVRHRVFSRGEDGQDTLTAILIVVGFVLRLLYILYTSAYDVVRQNDIRAFDENFVFDSESIFLGHGDYINWFLNNWSLPLVNPTNGMIEFYHPPLHHFIAGIWMRINLLLGFSFKSAVENVQILTLFYSSSCMITASKIFRSMKLKGYGRNIALAVIAFHPTFIYLSGNVNNDILSVALSLGAIYAAIVWYKNRTMKNILVVALCIGGAMMAKLSGGLVSIGVALIFIEVLGEVLTKKNKKAITDLFKQFLVFGIICVPLGLWWQVRNNILYGLQLSYIPPLSADSGQYVGNYSITQRLFDFSDFSNGVYMSSYEYNCPLGLLKSAMFGEEIFFEKSTFGYTICAILFWVNVVLVLISLVAEIYFLFFDRKKVLSGGLKKLLYGSVFMMMFGYITYNLSYAQSCVVNIRFIPGTIVVGAGFTGLLIQAMEKCSVNPKIISAYKIAISSLTVAFCCLTSIMYVLIA